MPSALADHPHQEGDHSIGVLQPQGGVGVDDMAGTGHRRLRAGDERQQLAVALEILHGERHNHLLGQAFWHRIVGLPHPGEALEDILFSHRGTLLLQGILELLQATSPSGAHAADRHVEFCCHLSVVRAVGERDQTQQIATSLIERGDGGPEPARLVGVDGLPLRRRRDADAICHEVVTVRHGAPRTALDLPGLPASGGAQPGRHCLGFPQRLSVAHQGEPGRLHHVLGFDSIQSAGPGDLPQARGQSAHQLVQGRRVMALDPADEDAGRLRPDRVDRHLRGLTLSRHRRAGPMVGDNGAHIDEEPPRAT